MDYKEQLRITLKNIKPINETSKKPSEINDGVITAQENPLDPHLFSYCFDNILQFDVEYQIFEKVNYYIEFDYKGCFCSAIHKKLGFYVYINQKHKQEFIELLKQSREILSNFFQELGKAALNENKFTMENEYYLFKEKFDFFSNKIYDLEKEKETFKTEKVEEIKAINDISTKIQFSNEYYQIERKYLLEEKYAIETYIDTFYSFLEHILTLLYPFTPNFDLSDPYAKRKIHNPRWTWDKKFIDVLSDDSESTKYLDDLREIKEVYRNRTAHGMFSRELKVYSEIDGFGRYPIYLGKNYLQGFLDDYSYYLSFDKFQEIKLLFDKVILLLRETYPGPMIFIEGGALIPVDVRLLTYNVQDTEEAEKLLEHHLFMLDNQLNMDW